MGMLKERVTARSEAVRLINDHCRQTFTGCLIVLTATVAELEIATRAAVLEKVRSFTDFDEDNNPHGENDMAFFDHDGERYFFKFDYYGDASHRTGANDPSDTTNTFRTLTIGTAADY